MDVTASPQVSSPSSVVAAPVQPQVVSGSLPSRSPAPVQGSGGNKKIWLIILIGVLLIAAVGAFIYFFNPFAIRGSVGISP